MISERVGDKETNLFPQDNRQRYLFFWSYSHWNQELNHPQRALSVCNSSSIPLPLALSSVTYVMTDSHTITEFDKWNIHPSLSGGWNIFARKFEWTHKKSTQSPPHTCEKSGRGTSEQKIATGEREDNRTQRLTREETWPRVYHKAGKTRLMCYFVQN